MRSNAITPMVRLFIRSIFIFLLLVIWVPQLHAYERYRDGCIDCHGIFSDGTSPKGSIFPTGDKHDMHRSESYMGTSCDLCHTTGDFFDPWIGSSNGTGTNPGYGCTGCHGREEDEGHDAISSGRGAGLRQHHWIAGATVCSDCHTDGEPSMYTPVGEDVLPTYFGTIDTNVDLPCNPAAMSSINENWTLADFIGLDNDGDGLYDGDDPDCQEGTTISCDMLITPASGTVGLMPPLKITFHISVTNETPHQRRIWGNIDAHTADGPTIAGFLKGPYNFAPREVLSFNYRVNVPSTPLAVGVNTFDLTVTDTTPPPFNQPPYPPSGDTCTRADTFEGVAP